MSKAKTLTTDKLIHSIKLRAMLPSTQNTFQPEDFLYFINEELDLGIVPHMRSFHEDFFLTTDIIELEPGVARYDVPHRASGATLRDITYNDGSQLCEMTRIGVEDQVDRINQFDSGYFLKEFYLEGSEIVIPTGLASVGAKLHISYYIRPNTMVEETNATVVTAINKNNGLVTVNQFPEVFFDAASFDITSSRAPFRLLSREIKPDGLATDSNLNFTFGTARAVSITMPALAAIDPSSYITVTDNSQSSPIVNHFWFDKTGTDTPPVISGNLYRVNISSAANTNDVIVILSALFNSTFVDNRLILAQTSTTTFTVQNGGNGVSVGNNFTITSTGLVISESVISEGTITIPSKLIVGDVIALPEETTIPQIPVELHSMLAQRAAMRCLEALGDSQGLQNAAAKLADMENKTGMIIDNRVESSPQKIRPRHTPIRRVFDNYRRR